MVPHNWKFDIWNNKLYLSDTPKAYGSCRSFRLNILQKMLRYYFWSYVGFHDMVYDIGFILVFWILLKY